jgi:hypothetical protein
MSKTIQIDPPKGYKFQSVDQSTGAINLVEVPKEITDRIKTFDDVLLELQVIPKDFAEQCSGLSRDEVAYRKIKLITEALNEGWTPDWTDGNWNKYYPWFKMGSPSGVGFSYLGYAGWRSYSYVGSRLCFKSSELAEYAGKTFESIYKDFLTLNN